MSLHSPAIITTVPAQRSKPNLHALPPRPAPVFVALSVFIDLFLMADRAPTQRATRPTTGSINNGNALTRKLQAHAPSSTQLVGFLAFIISGSILLLLSGITFAVTVLGVIFFTPLIIISTPIWLPAATILFFAVAGFLSFCGFWMALVAVLSWMYRYFRGLSPPGSDQFDYARSRFYDTASHVKDYGREYGGYLQSKVKDAAPGA